MTLLENSQTSPDEAVVVDTETGMTQTVDEQTDTRADIPGVLPQSDIERTARAYEQKVRAMLATLRQSEVIYSD